MITLKQALLPAFVSMTAWIGGNGRAELSFSTLASFNNTNGARPYSGLIQGADGNFYGTTSAGGENGEGTIFRLAPSGQLTNLWSFDGANGASPFGALLQAKDSNFYGTTYQGGSNNNGTVFQLSPNGSLRTLVWFNGSGGAWPRSGLVQGTDGFLYGTTAIGGTNSAGTVFQMTTNGAWTNLASFYTNGYSPYAGVIQGADGNFYGTTFQGGAYGSGTVYKLRPGVSISNIYSFTGSNDGGFPAAGLVQDPGGFLYGTTYYGGSNGFGAVFRLTTNGVISNLFSFSDTNGSYPQAGLVLGADGNFYGTTQAGGTFASESSAGYGTLFCLGTNGNVTTLFSFNGTNGSYPQSPLLKAGDGSFYGTTEGGGVNGYGTIFRFSLVPPAPPVFVSATIINSNLVLTWTAVIGLNYQMTYTTNLIGGAWSNLGGTVSATNNLMTTPDAFQPAAQRFYRIVLLQ